MEDSYGDGWNGTVLHVGDVSLSLDDYDTSSVTGTICLKPGVYTPYCCGGSYDSEVSLSVGGLSGGADDSCVGTAGSFTVEYSPTPQPTQSHSPTPMPTAAPTYSPTPMPTYSPTPMPTAVPTCFTGT